jgi:hypothetical protein
MRDRSRTRFSQLEGIAIAHAFFVERSRIVLRHSVAALIAILVVAGGLLAADKEVNAKVVKVDVKKKLLIVKIEDEKKEYNVNDDTKFLGPKGGLSDKGLSDDRLTPGAEVKLVIAGNNRTLREVHLPERKAKE